MALAAFSVGSGMRMLDPLLPMLAREFGTGLGSVAPLIGGFALAYGIGQFIFGPLGDRFGKMPVVACALACYALTLVGAGFSGGLASLLGWRVLSGLASAAVMPLFMAHIGDSVPYGQRQALIGQLLTGMVAAQMLAAPLSGTIGEYAGWRAGFLGLGLLALGITAFFALRLPRALWRKPAGPGGVVGIAGFLRLLEKPAGRRLMLASGCDGLLLFGGVFPFIASLLIERFALSPPQAGLVIAGFGIGALVYTRAAPWLVRRLGERRMVTIGGGGMVLVILAFALADAWWIVAVAQALAGLLFFMLHGVLQAQATEVLPEARGTAVAAFAMALFFGQSLGSIVFGTLIVWGGFSVSLLVAAAGVAVLSVWVRGTLRPAA